MVKEFAYEEVRGSPYDSYAKLPLLIMFWREIILVF